MMLNIGESEELIRAIFADVGSACAARVTRAYSILGSLRLRVLLGTMCCREMGPSDAAATR
jgi:hypothetical protein